MPPQNRERFVLFNVKDPDTTYSFAKELKDEIILRSSAESAVLSSDDDYARKLAQERGEVYFMDEPGMKEDFPVVLAVNNAQLFTFWKYYPSFKVLMEQDLLKNTAVYLMLSIYIAIICFAAVAIIAYTRSITIGMDNQMLFESLKKLGANNNYIKKVIRKQLVKIFSYPIIKVSSTIYIFNLMIFYFNDNRLTIGEIFGLLIDLLIIAVIGFFMYGVYRLSFSKIKHMVFKSQQKFKEIMLILLTNNLS